MKVRGGFRAFATAADRAGGRLETVDVEGTSHYVDAASHRPVTDASGPTVDLLQAYDEYIMGYAPPRDYLLPPDRSPSAAPEFPMHALVVDGVLAGRWAPVAAARSATVKLAPWREYSPDEERSLAASVAELERFLGVPVTVERLAAG